MLSVVALWSYKGSGVIVDCNVYLSRNAFYGHLAIVQELVKDLKDPNPVAEGKVVYPKHYKNYVSLCHTNFLFVSLI